MMSIINLFIKFFYIYMLNVKPARTVEQVKESNEDTTQLLVLSVKGFTTTFICQRIKYLVKYKNRLLNDEEFKIYKLSAAHSEEVPEALRSVLIEFHYLPSFKEIFISEEERRKIMIEAYIDLVTRKIDSK